jgi:aspartate aminotransferase
MNATLPLSFRTRRVVESQTLAQSARAKQMKESGIDVVDLTAGEPDFPTPDHVKEAAIAALRSDFTHYTANEGILDLRMAIAGKFAKENRLHYDAGQILVSTGAKHSIFNALQSICNPGDEVLFFSPYWVSYPEMIKLADATPVVINGSIENGFRPDIEQLRRLVSPNTKALLLNSPGNPSGVMYTRDELEQMAQLAREKNIFIISDEIYEKISFDGKQHLSIGSFDGMADRVITINGLSKAYAMTGWRIGFLGGPPDVVAAAAKVQSQTTSNPNSIAQKAALAAITGSQEPVHSMVCEFSRRRDFIMELAADIPDLQIVAPEGAFYLLCGVSRFYGRRYGSRVIRDSVSITDYLLQEHHVALVPGSPFGMDGCMRLSFASSKETLKRGLERIRAGLAQLSHD